MATTKTQLSALSRLFSPGVFKQLASKGRSPLFASLYQEAGLTGKAAIDEHTVSSAFESAFAQLRRSNYRDEYVYRAALTHNILLGRHSLNTASMLTEFRTGASKADLAILNGTGTVYEIKSDRDSLARLDNQIKNYQKVFAKIYVIVGDAHLKSMLSETPKEVGILKLNNRHQITTERPAIENTRSLCPETMFNSLRVSEAIEILANLGISTPEVPNTLLRATISDLFQSVAPLDIHIQMVRVLKKTRSLSSLKPFVDQLPTSLQPIALSTKVEQKNHKRLLQAVKTPLEEAMTWA